MRRKRHSWQSVGFRKICIIRLHIQNESGLHLSHVLCHCHFPTKRLLTEISGCQRFSELLRNHQVCPSVSRIPSLSGRRRASVLLPESSRGLILYNRLNLIRLSKRKCYFGIFFNRTDQTLISSQRRNSMEMNILRQSRNFFVTNGGGIRQQLMRLPCQRSRYPHW